VAFDIEEATMHKCLSDLPDQDKPCNVYCHDYIHVDLAYTTPEYLCYSKEKMIQIAQTWHEQETDGRCKCEILDMVLIQEAPSVAERYRVTLLEAKTHTIIFRITYRVHEEE
jgi:hypothetical protein